MARKSSFRRLLTPGRVISGVVILAGLALFIFSFLSTTDLPVTQLELEAGILGPQRLNVWLDPDPPELGDLTVIAQVVDVGGNPRLANSIKFMLGRSDDQPASSVEGVEMEAGDMTKRGRFRASLEIVEPGDWWIAIEIDLGTQHLSAQLPVRVSE